MQRYFAINSNLELNKDDYRHIATVMKMKKDDIIEIVYDGIVYRCKLNSINPIKYDVENKSVPKPESKKIISAFSLVKEQKIDYLIQKGTEVGIDYFIPIKSMRSIINISDSKKATKISRWKKIAKEASEQSFRVRVPEISDIKNLKDIINIKADIKLLLSVNEKTKNLKNILHNNNNYDTILIVTGPEGGFDSEEEKLLIENGFISVSLGNNILRAETAPVVTASMIKYEYMR